ncbi:unnamed protein product [Clavelina lepadiformis]|uniref:Uncharacterized protein n=1 Tax=Clavelina lepadiformis TaxID=159417 RepID=A0ABP0G3E5_CLALP
MTKMLTTPGIPRQSPIQVLTGSEVAKLPRSNEIGSTPPGNSKTQKVAINLIEIYTMTKMLTTPGIPRRSPIQVLTGPEVASLPRSNEIGSTQHDMVVGDIKRNKKAFSIIIRLNRKVKNANSCYKFD